MTQLNRHHRALTAARAASVLLALAGTTASTTASAQTLDTRLVASGLSQPLFATAPLADGRLFVAEKGGLIKVVQAGVASTFLSVPVATGGEQGLLGLAFDPNYGNAASAGFGRFFVDYIDPTTLDTVVASYRRNAATGLADPSSRVEVLRIDQPNGRSNHKAGWIGFKPGDVNNLYIATGDGGASNDPENRAQNKGELLGKLLRVDINRDDFADPDINYGVPLNNPFVGQAGARGEIYALGLRNPFRNSFDSATGNLWIADVGQSAREEIDFIGSASAGGQNFGWRQREGSIATPGITDPPTAGLIDPLLDYDHSFGASITGGYVVRDANSALNGRYVFGDFISGRIFSIAADGSAQTMAGATELTAVLDAGRGGVIGNISSFGQGASGEFYIVDYAGKVVQVVPEPATALMMSSRGCWPALAATSRALSRWRLSSSTSTPSRRSSPTTATCPASAAKCNAVCPVAPQRSTSTPARTSSRTVLCRPAKAAAPRAVKPSSPTLSVFVPRLSRSRTSSSWPACAASTSGWPPASSCALALAWPAFSSCSASLQRAVRAAASNAASPARNTGGPKRSGGRSLRSHSVLSTGWPREAAAPGATNPDSARSSS